MYASETIYSHSFHLNLPLKLIIILQCESPICQLTCFSSIWREDLDVRLLWVRPRPAWSEVKCLNYWPLSKSQRSTTIILNWWANNNKTAAIRFYFGKVSSVGYDCIVEVLTLFSGYVVTNLFDWPLRSESESYYYSN